MYGDFKTHTYIGVQVGPFPMPLSFTSFPLISPLKPSSSNSIALYETFFVERVSAIEIGSPCHHCQGYRHNDYCGVILLPGEQDKVVCHILTQTKKKGKTSIPLALALTYTTP